MTDDLSTRYLTDEVDTRSLVSEVTRLRRLENRRARALEDKAVFWNSHQWLPDVLSILRLLEKAGDTGMLAGVLAWHFDSPHSNASVNDSLHRLKKHGYVHRGGLESTSWRHGATYRWYLTPQGHEYLTLGGPERGRRRRRTLDHLRSQAQRSQAQRKEQKLYETARSLVSSTDLSRKHDRNLLILRLHEQGLTFARIASLIGLTRERVRQIVRDREQILAWTPPLQVDVPQTPVAVDVPQVLGNIRDDVLKIKVIPPQPGYVRGRPQVRACIACGRIKRIAGYGYCSACFGRWVTQGKPAEGLQVPYYETTSNVTYLDLAPDHVPDAPADQRGIVMSRRYTDVMSGTSKWQCSCGYQASSQQDLDEHTAAMAPYEPEGAHHQRVR